MVALDLRHQPLELAFRRVMPKLGQVMVAVRVVRPLAGDKALVEIDTPGGESFSISNDRLLVSPQGFWVAGLLVEHQRQPGALYGHRYFGRVLIDQQPYDVPPAAIFI